MARSRHRRGTEDATPSEPRQPDRALATTTDAEKLARNIRELCRHASGDAGLVLCDMLLKDAVLLKDGGRPIGSIALPPSAWKVLVRLMEEWLSRGERGLEQYSQLEELRCELRPYRHGPDKRAKTAGDRQELIQQMMDAGCNDAKKIRHELLNTYGIKVAVKTVRNNMTKIRKSK
jgi:hypothetical protein